MGLGWAFLTDVGADCLDFTDPVVDHALSYMYQFNHSQGLLICLNEDPIKRKGSNNKLDGWCGSIVSCKFTVLHKDLSQINSSSIGSV